jgi:hypothetical protein
MTSTIPVASTSPAPVAVFTNPATGGITANPQVEALAIVNRGDGKQLCHVARDQATDDMHAGDQPAPQQIGQNPRVHLVGLDLRLSNDARLERVGQHDSFEG